LIALQADEETHEQSGKAEVMVIENRHAAPAPATSRRKPAECALHDLRMAVRVIAAADAGGVVTIVHGATAHMRDRVAVA